MQMNADEASRSRAPFQTHELAHPSRHSTTPVTRHPTLDTESDHALERKLEQPDVVVGPYDLLVGRRDPLDESFQHRFVLECDHEHRIHARIASSAEVRFGAVAFALRVVPPRVVIDALALEKLHDIRSEVLVV